MKVKTVCQKVSKFLFKKKKKSAENFCTHLMIPIYESSMHDFGNTTINYNNFTPPN